MEKSLSEWVLTQVERRTDWFVELCQELVRIPSLNPPGDTTEIHQHVKKLLDARDIEYKEYSPRKNNPNLVAVLGSGSSPRLTLNGHYDTFPIGDRSAWSEDPFSGSIKDGRLYGRGASDMKAGVAAALGIFLLFAEERTKFDGTLVLNLVSDEETGSEWGAWWLAENVPDILGDACLIGEPTGVLTPLIGQKAPLWVRVKTKGTPQHGAYSDGRDAVWEMARAISAIQTLNELHYPPPDEIAPLVEALKEKTRLTGVGQDWWLERPSVNFGVISGGVKVNVVPYDCQVELDLRVPFGASSEQILSELEKRLQQADVDVEIEVIMGKRDNPNFTPWDNPFIQVLRGAIQAATHADPEPLLMPYFTDERVFRKYGIPTASCGPLEHNMGGPDEHILIEEYLQVVRTFGLTAAEFCRAHIA